MERNNRPTKKKKADGQVRQPISKAKVSYQSAASKQLNDKQNCTLEVVDLQEKMKLAAQKVAVFLSLAMGHIW